MHKKIEIRKWSTHYNVAIWSTLDQEGCHKSSSLRVRVASSRSHLNKILKDEGSCVMNTRWVKATCLVD